MVRAVSCRMLVRVGLVAIPAGASAALAPVYQNPKDVAVMVAFAQAHPVVMQSLRSIDLEHRVIHFGKDCVARFARVAASPMPGPAPALAFASSNCPVDREEAPSGGG